MPNHRRDLRRALGPATTGIVLAVIGVLMLYPIDDFDVWWLLRAGRHMVETRSFLTTDPFSGPAFGAPWVNHAWGFELLLYGIHRLGGTTGLEVLQALFAVATFGILYGLLRREGAGRAWALVGILAGALATRGFWAPRPQVVTYLALAAFWTILRDHLAGRADRLAWLPVLTVGWANLHGGFMVGPGLVALCLAGEGVDRLFPGGPPSAGRPGRLLVALGASLVATLATPFHYHAVLFPFQVLGDRLAQAFVIEWVSPAFEAGAVRAVEVLVLLTLGLSVSAPRAGRLGATDVLAAAAFLHFGLQATRNLPLLVVVILPILMAVLLATVRERLPAVIAALGERGRPLAVPALVVVVGVLVWWSIPPGSLRRAVPRVGVADVFPAEAVAYLRHARPPGPLFNEYGWGGYLIWSVYPDYRVSIDGRMAVHGPERFADYLEVAGVRARWRETLDRLGARLAVLRARSPLATVLRAAPEWEVLHEDRIAIVLGKRGPGP